uniref:Uncharacterized protein n=1 Tax=Avena sativa TaxID=4498 RepID=A0ACD5TQI4_AVESA
MERRATVVLLMLLSLEAVLLVSAAVADDAAVILLPGDAVMDGTGKPWECCDRPVCTRGGKWCGCKDEVAKCADGCNNCREVKGSDPARYMCRDSTRDGRPDPCTKTPGNN